MAITDEFIKGVNETITDDQVAVILKEYDSDITGLKLNRDDLKKERDTFKANADKLTADYGTKEADFQKQIEALNAQIKASDSDQLKAYYEAEVKKVQEMSGARLTEAEKLIALKTAENEVLNAEYLKVLKNTELDRAMDGLSNLIPDRKNILRDVFWARNSFELTELEGVKRLLTKETYKSIADTLTAFIATDEGKSFLLNNNSGGGASGSTTTHTSTKNPWKKETLNITEQILLTKENPTLAAQLKAQAGV